MPIIEDETKRFIRVQCDRCEDKDSSENANRTECIADLEQMGWQMFGGTLCPKCRAKDKYAA